MAKKTDQTKTEAVVTTAVVKTEASPLANLVGASPELLERIKEVQDNITAVDNFKLPRVKATSEGMQVMEEEAAVMELEGVLVHAKRSNVYYDKPYNKREPEPPRCMSLDGIVPDPKIKDPISTKCRGCPMSEFGTNSMKSGKACRNLKPWFLLLSDEAILPRQLTISPTSLKAADNYLMNLTERGLNYRKVKTKITAFKSDQDDTFVKFKFAMTGKLDAQRIADVECIRSSLLPLMNAQDIEQREFETQAVNNEQKDVDY